MRRALPVAVALTLIAALTPSFTLPARAALNYTWQNVNPQPIAENIRHVAANRAGVIVAVTSNGTLLRSADDGTTWSTVKSNTGCVTVHWSAVHNRFVALGSYLNGSFFSADGLTWSVSQRPTGRWEMLSAIAEGNGIMVAVGSNGYIDTSTDGGATWVGQTSAVIGSTAHLDRVAWTGSLFIAVGGATNAQILVTSPDGITWTQQDVATAIATLPPTTSVSPLAGVVWDGTRQIASTGNLYSLVSTDGVTWSALTVDPLAAVNTFGKATAWNGRQYCAVGQRGAFVSSDGIVWNQTLTLTQSNQYVEDITWDGAQWIAVGSGGLIFTSPDGQTWTERSGGIHESLTGAAYGNNLYVVVGSSNGRIATSPDGVTWSTQTSNTTQPLRAVVWTGNQFVAVGTSAGAVVTSPDGIAWTVQTVGSAMLVTLAWNGTTLVAGGSDGVNHTWTSTDAITWTPHPANGNLGYLGSAMIWEPTLGLFVEVGFGGGIATSPDGITWTPRTSGATTDLLSVASDGNGRLVTAGPAVLVSTDAVTWSPTTFPSTASSSIVWDGSRYLIPLVKTQAGSTKSTLYTSTDGITWSDTPTDLRRIAGKGAIFEPSTGKYLTVDQLGAISLGAVIPNRPPVFSAPPFLLTNNVNIGDKVFSWNASARDPDGDLVSYTYVWRRNGVVIPGEVTYSYVTTPSDVGIPIDLTITVDDGLGGVTSATTPPVTITNHRPVFTGIPTLSATGNNVGDVISLLDTGVGDTDGDPVTVSYQWLMDGWVPLGNNPTFTITTGELGAGISCELSADDGKGGTARAATNTLAAFNNPPVFVTPPTIPNISSSVGTVLGVRAEVTDDNNAATPTLTYQWRASGVDIPGATGTDYTVTPADIGVALDCMVTADDGNGGVATATTATHQAGNNIPNFPNAPNIANTGTVAVGDVLTLIDTAATDIDGDIITLSYQWQANNIAIPSATGATYTVTNNDVGVALDCIVTATDPFGAFAVELTARTVFPGNLPPAFIGPPTIANAAPKVGDTLTLASAASDPNGDIVTFYYRWRANGVGVPMLPNPTFTVTPTYAHQSIDCVVSISDLKSAPVQAITAVTVVANTAPIFDAAPAIANTTIVAGDTLILSSTTSDADGDPVALSYQWRADGIDIPGATSATYTPTTSGTDVVLTCDVTASDGQGGTVTAVTAARTLPGDGSPTSDPIGGDGGGGGCFIGTVGF